MYGHATLRLFTALAAAAVFDCWVCFSGGANPPHSALTVRVWCGFAALAFVQTPAGASALDLLV
jgi:hypothetical protein